MPTFFQHEILDLQEHIRVEAATAQACQQFAQVCQDQDLRSFCEQEARTAAASAQRLLSLLQQGRSH